MKRTLLQGAAAAALAVCAALPAQAVVINPYVLNTGTPTGGLAQSNMIGTENWVAESFTLQSTTTINSILTYALSTSDASDAGQTFTVALYGSKTQGSAKVPNVNWYDPSGNQGQLDQFEATYTAGGGWIGQSGLNWTLAAGTYFVAVEVDANDGVSGLQLPTGVSNAPANVALYTGGQGYAADTTPAADAFGLQVAVVTAVPEPSSAALLLAGLAFAGGVARRRSRR